MDKKKSQFSIKNVIRKPYTYVPECPACGSPMTGRFFRERIREDSDWIMLDGLKAGELLEPAPQIDPDNTLFCYECHFTWTEPLSVRWLTLKEIENQKQLRHTYEFLKNKTDTEEKEKKGFLSKIFR